MQIEKVKKSENARKDIAGHFCLYAFAFFILHLSP